MSAKLHWVFSLTSRSESLRSSSHLLFGWVRRIHSSQQVRFCSTGSASRTGHVAKGALRNHIQTCMSHYKNARDTGFNIVFLGTGGMLPNKQRMTTSTMLRLGGLTYLFDAGEGIQRQLISTRISLREIQKIFVTHLHGDHILGLPGLLMGLQQIYRNKSKMEIGRQLEIYGPPGLFNYIATSLMLTRTHFHCLDVVVYELVGGAADRLYLEQLAARQQKTRDIMFSHYPEIANDRLIRKQIHRNEDGVWILGKPDAITLDAVKEASTNRHRLPNDLYAGAQKQVYIKAAEVEHQQYIQTFGFVVQEQEPPKKIDVNKAIELGVKPGPKYRILKQGFSVQSDDGTREILPHEVLLQSDNNRARKLAVLGDNCRLSRGMSALLQDVDVLVHEATMDKERKQEAIARGHATSEMAGFLAKQVGAKALVLNHISPKIQTAEQIHKLVKDAEAANEGASLIVAAYDFMELLVPRTGF